MGGENSVGDVVSRDPWTLLAPLGLATGGLGLAGIGPLAGLGGLLGAGEAAGAGLAAGSGEAALAGLGGEAGTALGFAGEAAGGGGGALGAIDSALAASPEALFPGYGTAAAGDTAALADAGSLFPGYGANIPGATTRAAGGDSFLSQLGTGAMRSITNNPLGTAAAAGGLGLNMLRGNPQDPNRQKLQQQADQLGAQGEQLKQYLTSGTLPPALKASLDQATAAARARIISNHAKSGMPTDPSQNSALAQELNGVEMNAVAAMASAQMDMLKTGLNETGLSTQLYEMLVKMDKSNNDDLMKSIANFASALGGGGARGGASGQTFRLQAA